MVSVVVAGAGVAGLATALLLARDGHQVAVVERDPDAGPDIAPAARRGIPHYLQPHAFIPRGRAELRESLPDVYDDLIARGAWDADLRPKLPGAVVESDELLQYVAVRRPLLETALRAAVLDDPRITVRRGERLTSVPEADLVVDALGRTSFLREPTETTDCGVVYYCRYYRLRDGIPLPDGPWLLSPRGDLGYFAFASFPGDNGTFGLVFAVPPGDQDWKRLRDPEVYEAAVASVPQLAMWRDPGICEPITEVLAMAGLRNTAPPDSLPAGLAAVGDSFSHTDPTLAHGLAFALIHARALRDVLREHTDPGDVTEAYFAAVRPLSQERFEFSSAFNAQRLHRWRGGEVDFDRDRELFTMVAGGALAASDPEVFRMHFRRIGLLESVSVLADDDATMASLRKRLAELEPKPLGPSREEMVALVRRDD